jgi:hypothetical protein
MGQGVPSRLDRETASVVRCALAAMCRWARRFKSCAMALESLPCAWVWVLAGDQVSPWTNSSTCLSITVSGLLEGL